MPITSRRRIVSVKKEPKRWKKTPAKDPVATDDKNADALSYTHPDQQPREEDRPKTDSDEVGSW